MLLAPGVGAASNIRRMPSPVPPKYEIASFNEKEERKILHTFVWNHAIQLYPSPVFPKRVELAGDFNGWKRYIMQRATTSAANRQTFYLTWPVQKGKIVFKFIVDGEWKVDPSLPTITDERGNVNNILDINVDDVDTSKISDRSMLNASQLRRRSTSDKGSPGNMPVPRRTYGSFIDVQASQRHPASKSTPHTPRHRNTLPRTFSSPMVLPDGANSSGGNDGDHDESDDRSLSSGRILSATSETSAMFQSPSPFRPNQNVVNLLELSSDMADLSSSKENDPLYSKFILNRRSSYQDASLLRSETEINEIRDAMSNSSFAMDTSGSLVESASSRLPSSTATPVPFQIFSDGQTPKTPSFAFTPAAAAVDISLSSAASPAAWDPAAAPSPSHAGAHSNSPFGRNWNSLGRMDASLSSDRHSTPLFAVPTAQESTANESSLLFGGAVQPVASASFISSGDAHASLKQLQGLHSKSPARSTAGTPPPNWFYRKFCSPV